MKRSLFLLSDWMKLEIAWLRVGRVLHTNAFSHTSAKNIALGSEFVFELVVVSSMVVYFSIRTM